MRELRVVGVDADGSQVICQDAESGEKFTIAADEKLRAAARGDLSRLGQIEIEMTSMLRPREIQARIRSGATIAEVAAIAGVGVDKIERFAHPVLLERTRAAELAALAHPFRHDGPSDLTLGEVVTEGLIAFGQNPSEADWDAWKGEDGYWAVQVSWKVGHTEHRAHWRYHPGSHGGTADPLDDLAEELTHPELIEPRRRLTPVATPVIAPAAIEVVDEGHEQVTVDADMIIDAQRTRRNPRRAAFDENGTYALDFDVPSDPDDQHGRHRDADGHVADVRNLGRAGLDQDTAAEDWPDEDLPAQDFPEHDTEPADQPIDHIVDVEVEVEYVEVTVEAAGIAPPEADEPQVVETQAVETEVVEPEPVETATPEPHDTAQPVTDAEQATDAEPVTDADDEPATETPTPVTPPRRRKNRKPAVPAWEDVLLGVRSHPNN